MWLPINLKFCAIDHHNLHRCRFINYRLICIVLSISCFLTWVWPPINLKFCLIDRLNLLCYRFIDVWLIAYKLTALAIGISRWKHLLRLLTLQWTMTLPPPFSHTHYPPRRCHILFSQCEIRLEHLSWSVKCLTSYFPTSKHQKSSNNCCWRTQKKTR